jgi:hypothetical protein
MIDPPVHPEPYEVAYSDRVREELTALIVRARERGVARAALEAARLIHDRLRIYPQFGDPLRDVSSESGQERIAVVPPLVVRYVVYEDRRLVCVVRPMRLLSGFGK